ncbi:fimbrial chaperone protein [Salmonella enterica subsp. enterica serovar Oranienburg]|nr:fimbrial chaperone [Salmonella enterica subsp. enterica serovar Newport]EBW6364253.1 fimbrial chaperone protein [Salmonella enterica subsp. enterica serovar Oranienburg]EDU7787243.1 fimbrial chaperone [Salmonella enterica subsp. enterica serovar Oranienburg]HAK8205019.1 fimbrial chaperone [Salmonella enterica]
MKKTIWVAILSGILAAPSLAAFSLNGTRYIYEEGKKNISFEVSNSNEETWGGQVWIDNESQNKNDVFIVPSPPFFKVDGGSKQIIRLMNVSDTLPKDRESLFMLNVQEVPPMPKNAEGNVIAIAMNTRVKVIYRPKALTEGRRDAEKQLTLVNRDGSLWIKNPTPYYFAVVKVKNKGIEQKLTEEVVDSLSQLKPFSEVNTRLKNLSGEVSVDALNDWGGAVNYVVK